MGGVVAIVAAVALGGYALKQVSISSINPVILCLISTSLLPLAAKKDHTC